MPGEEGLLKSGYDEVSLTSLTTGSPQCAIPAPYNPDLRKRARISIPSADAWRGDADAVSTLTVAD